MTEEELNQPITITRRELLNIQAKAFETAGDTFMAFGAFYSNEIDMANDACERAKANFEELHTTIDKIDKNNPFIQLYQ